jgi:hypothetical protein
MKQFIEDVTDWVEEFVSVKNETLGHIPCPFAKRAILDDKIIWLTASTISDLEKIITWQSNKELWGNKEVLIIGMKKDSITPFDLHEKIQSINQKVLIPNGLVALEDHPETIETINSVKMNQGEWVLVLIQSIDKLNRASEILKKQGYYDNWSKENLDDVVNWRN